MMEAIRRMLEAGAEHRCFTEPWRGGTLEHVYGCGGRPEEARAACRRALAALDSAEVEVPRRGTEHLPRPAYVRLPLAGVADYLGTYRDTAAVAELFGQGDRSSWGPHELCCQVLSRHGLHHAGASLWLCEVGAGLRRAARTAGTES